MFTGNGEARGDVGPEAGSDVTVVVGRVRAVIERRPLLDQRDEALAADLALAVAHGVVSCRADADLSTE